MIQLIHENNVYDADLEIAAKKLEWEYNGPYFEVAQKDVRVTPAAIPIIMAYWVANNRIISPVELADAIINHKDYSRSGNCDFVNSFVREHGEYAYVLARSYQFVTGVSREFHAALFWFYMNSSLLIIKDVDKDLKKDADIFVGRSVDSLIPVQIRNKGKASDEFVKERKWYKSMDGVVELKARMSDDPDSDLNVVPDDVLVDFYEFKII